MITLSVLVINPRQALPDIGDWHEVASDDLVPSKYPTDWLMRTRSLEPPCQQPESCPIASLSRSLECSMKTSDIRQAYRQTYKYDVSA